MQPTTITPETASDIKLFYVYFAGFITVSFRFILCDLIFQGWEKKLNLNLRKLGAITCIDYDLSQSSLIQSIFEFPLIMLVIFNLLILKFRSKNGYNSAIIKKKNQSSVNLLKSINQYGIKY